MICYRALFLELGEECKESYMQTNVNNKTKILVACRSIRGAKTQLVQNNFEKHAHFFLCVFICQSKMQFKMLTKSNKLLFQ